MDTSENNTPSRSGLRKRKRPETPQKTEKQVSEEWVDEDQLQLWEIKLFGEKCVINPYVKLFQSIKKSGNQSIFLKINSNRIEKALLQPVTRTSTGKLPATRSNSETPVQSRTNAMVKGGATPSSLVNSKQVTIGHKATPEEIKEKMEQELRIQRAEHHKKRTLEMMQQKKGK